MNDYELNMLRKLDPTGTNGTIQGMIMENNSNMSFQQVCYTLLHQTISEKYMLMNENAKLVKVLKDNNLYTSENIL